MGETCDFYNIQPGRKTISEKKEKKMKKKVNLKLFNDSMTINDDGSVYVVRVHNIQIELRALKLFPFNYYYNNLMDSEKCK